jgi:hypothetical protein
MGMICHVSVVGDPEHPVAPHDPWVLPFQNGAATAERVSLEKAWHGLHYLLTGKAWGGDGPAAFLVAGGKQLDEEERWFEPDETKRIHQELSRISDDQLWARFDAEEMERQEIYPGIWDESGFDLREEYLEYFHVLKRIVAAAAESGQGLSVSIG